MNEYQLSFVVHSLALNEIEYDKQIVQTIFDNESVINGEWKQIQLQRRCMLVGCTLFFWHPLTINRASDILQKVKAMTPRTVSEVQITESKLVGPINKLADLKCVNVIINL
jgi:hypothetical protein